MEESNPYHDSRTAHSSEFLDSERASDGALAKSGSQHGLVSVCIGYLLVMLSPVATDSEMFHVVVFGGGLVFWLVGGGMIVLSLFDARAAKGAYLWPFVSALNWLVPFATYIFYALAFPANPA